MAIEIINFRKFEKHTLMGFFTIRMTSIGLEIRDCTLHQKDGRRWVGLPSKPYKKEDGTAGHSYIVKFPDKAKWEQFQKQRLEALQQNLISSGEEPSDEEIRF